MITVEKYIEISKIYNDAWEQASQELKSITLGRKNEMGLVNEETRKSEEYKQAKKRYNFAFQMVRKFNKTVPNKIKREASKIRRKEKYGVEF